MVRKFPTNLISGKHYAKTCEDWLKLLLKNQKEAKKDLKDTYGDKADVWFNRWIVFYLVNPPIVSEINPAELRGVVCV